MDIRSARRTDLSSLIHLHDAAFGTPFEGRLVADLKAAGLVQASTQGWEAVIVLGHPEYYARFAFDAGLLKSFQAPFDGPAFMALELRKSALSGRKGRIIYPAPFRITDAPPRAQTV